MLGKRYLLIWLLLAAIVTSGGLLVEAAVQQNYRQSANDPQIQLSEDLAGVLGKQVARCLLVSPRLDISQTLAPFMEGYDANGQPVNICVPGNPSTAPIGQLNGAMPKLPAGVFEFTKVHGQDRFTWEPQTGLRFASVLTYYHDRQTGFAFAARSLREVEKRESTLNHVVLLAWLVGIVLSTIATKLSWLTRS